MLDKSDSGYARRRILAWTFLHLLIAGCVDGIRRHLCCRLSWETSRERRQRLGIMLRRILHPAPYQRQQCICRIQAASCSSTQDSNQRQKLQNML